MPKRHVRLSADQVHILTAVAIGTQLRDHRDIEGGKIFQLHALDGSVIATVSTKVVHELVDLGLIDSNKKFPAATYWLSSTGKRVAEDMGITPTGLTAQL